MVRAVPMNIADQPPEKKRSALFLPEEEWVALMAGSRIQERGDRVVFAALKSS